LWSSDDVEHIETDGEGVSDDPYRVVSGGGIVIMVYYKFPLRWIKRFSKKLGLSVGFVCIKEDLSVRFLECEKK
jgi:hypothetical protein